MGTMNDEKIVSHMKNGLLVSGGDKKQVSGSSYELRMGRVYYDLTESDKPIQLANDDYALIKPGHRVVLITKERLEIPDDVVARILSKGSLFSIGLTPVATYADPGFRGKIGIVTQNVSDKYITIPQDVSIAKVEFTSLSSASQTPYRGQHGFETEIWPIKHHLQKTYLEVRDDHRVGTEKEEAYRIMPDVTASLLRKLEKRTFFLALGVTIVIIINAAAILLVGGEMFTHLEGFIIGLLSSAAVMVGAWYAGRRA